MRARTEYMAQDSRERQHWVIVKVSGYDDDQVMMKVGGNIACNQSAILPQ
jgi:hypothetical protein